jgi:hypothetical protein
MSTFGVFLVTTVPNVHTLVESDDFVTVGFRAQSLPTRSNTGRNAWDLDWSVPRLFIFVVDDHFLPGSLASANSQFQRLRRTIATLLPARVDGT